jgi:HAD superfamily hydrolase (TIGR01509 family)
MKPLTEADYHFGARYATPLRLAWHVTGDVNDPIGVDLGKQFDDLYVGLVSTETAPLFDGMRDLLNRISTKRNNEFKVGALSNACGAYVHNVLRVNSISSAFDVEYGADEVPEPKPSPAGLLYCCTQCGVEPTSCIYIGDSPTDGKAAKAAGMLGIGVSWGSNAKDKLVGEFDHVVDTVAELGVLLDDLALSLI